MTLKLKRLLFPNKEQERGTNWQVLHVAAVHCSEDHGTVCPSIQIIQSEVPHQRRSRVNKQVHTVQREREPNPWIRTTCWVLESSQMRKHIGKNT